MAKLRPAVTCQCYAVRWTAPSEYVLVGHRAYGFLHSGLRQLVDAQRMLAKQLDQLLPDVV